MPALTIPKDYGYVMLVGVGSSIMMLYLGKNVSNARKKFGVQYPSLYADQAAAEKDENKKLFNCYQRAHQSALELYPSFLFYLGTGGIGYPKASAVLGLIWIAGRLVFAHGYYSGDPEKRHRGAFQYIGFLGLKITTVMTALGLLVCYCFTHLTFVGLHQQVNQTFFVYSFRWY